MTSWNKRINFQLFPHQSRFFFDKLKRYVYFELALNVLVFFFKRWMLGICRRKLHSNRFCYMLSLCVAYGTCSVCVYEGSQLQQPEGWRDGWLAKIGFYSNGSRLTRLASSSCWVGVEGWGWKLQRHKVCLCICEEVCVGISMRLGVCVWWVELPCGLTF